MTKFDEDLVSRARSIRVSPQYIEYNLLPLAQTEEGREALRQEYECAWITCERSAFDTV